MNAALNEFEPQLIIYNAGTDVLQGDKLGGLSLTDNVGITCTDCNFTITINNIINYVVVSFQGIIIRDEMVFRKAVMRKIPIVMLTSGGYLKKTAKIIANSIMNLYKEGLITGPQEYYF